MTYVKDCFGEGIRVGNSMHPHTPTQVDVEMNGLRADNARLRARVAELKEERDEIHSAARAVVGVKRYREALERIVVLGKQTLGGDAVDEFRTVKDIARKALEGGE